MALLKGLFDERTMNESKQADEEQLRFKTLFESAPGLFLVLTPELKIAAVSDAYLRATMTNREQILGKDIFEVFPDNPEDPTATGTRNLRDSLDRVLRNRAPDVMAVQKYDIRRPEAEGGGFEERYWSPVNSPVFGPLKELAYIIHRVEDVTEFVRVKQLSIEQNNQAAVIQERMERMEAEIYLRAQQLQQLNRQLREANDALQTEIAERKRTEEALQASEARFRLLVAEVKDYAIFLLDPQGYVLSWNAGAERIKGYRAEEIVGQHFSRFYPEEDVQRGKTQRELTSAAVEGRCEDEGWRVRKDGSKFWANTIITALHDESGILKGFSKITRDLTEHKRSAEALRQSEMRFRSVAQSAHEAIISADSNGHIISWNKGAQTIFGYEEEEVLGKPLTHLMPECHRGPHQRGLERLRSGEGSRLIGKTVELQGLRKDGREFPLELSLASWEVDGATFFTGIIRDITERKQVEEEILRLNQKLLQSVTEVERANKELEAFSYSVSHDLRAPLRAMDGFSRILLEDYGPGFPDEARRYLHLVRDNARQMGQLIDDLLGFARLSRQPLKKQPIVPADLVRQVLEDLRGEQQGRRVVIGIGELPPCQADPTLLRQVFANLLDNALKYTRQREEAVIEIGCRNPGDSPGEPVYFVKDNGVGFDMCYAHKLFGVFQRLHRAEDYEGTGVGLATVQRIIHRHGGRVWAEAEVNQGATFLFTLGGDAPRA